MNDELSSEARKVIEAARGYDDASPEDRERVKGRWLAAAAAGASASVLTEAARAAGQTSAWGLKGAVVAALAVAAGAFSIWWEPSSSLPQGPSGAQGPKHGEATEAAAPEAAPVAETVAAEPEVETAKPAPAPVAEVRPEPEPVVAEASDVSRVRETPKPAVAKPSAPGPAIARPAAPVAARAPGLGEEISMIAAARSALAGGDAGHALELLTRYEERFEEPRLRSEARALSVDALCQTGRRDEARRAAERFLAAWPGSPLSERVRNACP